MDPYQILGVSKSSTDEEIKAAYKKLAKQYHPDLNPGNSDKMKEINQAFDMIKTKEKRQEFEHSKMFSGNTYSQSGFRSHHFDEFSDLFSHIFGQRTASQKKPTNRTYQYSAVLTLDDVYYGKVFDFEPVFPSGKKKLHFKLPPGTVSGDYVLKGVGDESVKNSPPGDVVVKVEVKLDAPYMRIVNADLYRTIEVDALDAILGTSKEIDCVGKRKVKINIPAGITDGMVLKVEKMGLPVYQRRSGEVPKNTPPTTHGNLFLQVVIVTTLLDNKQKDELKKLMDSWKK